ncbi:hypothetical protein [Streptomyces cyaneogriseus]|uniref:hypothetical protein n=1 Tax=Streptomyces cyaneogriseus TaxID=68192 RepID=UPI0005CA2250|nr:hypothetical protein [Streptomyces cyaneogriseus]
MAVAAGLAGVLALTACSDDGGSGKSGHPTASGDRSSAGSGASATADAGGGTGGPPPAASARLEGSWLTTAGGRAVALVVTGRKAAAFTTGGSVCSGTAGGAAGREVIRLTCSDGNKDRSYGTVDSVAGTTLKVTWEGGAGPETYTKAEGGRFPSGLPTSGLGS